MPAWERADFTFGLALGLGLELGLGLGLGSGLGFMRCLTISEVLDCRQIRNLRRRHCFTEHIVHKYELLCK